MGVIVEEYSRYPIPAPLVGVVVGKGIPKLRLELVGVIQLSQAGRLLM
jgi:hypothetical protein